MDLTWLYPRNIVEFVFILLTTLALDYLYPLHKGILYRVHPVHTAYFMALKLFHLLPKTKAMGIVIWFTVVFTHMVVYGLLLYLTNLVSRTLWLIVAIYIMKVSTALKLLLNHISKTVICLEKNDVICARKAIAGAVRRDVSKLGEGHIASAAIETLFENIVDGFTSPLLYYLFAGPLGAFFQRLVNTMDAALGYKVGDLAKVGWFSAKVDSIINYISTRTTALLMIMFCPLINGSPRNSLKILKRDGKNVESINGRVIISFASGCLGIKLEKVGVYSVGKEFYLPKRLDLAKALKLSAYLCITYIVMLPLLYKLYVMINLS